MTSDVIMNKVMVIKRCIRRIHEVYDNDPRNLSDYTKQDSIVLNIQRACEAAIDLAMHIVAEKELGLPQSSREAFDLLQQNHIIDGELSARLKAMVGFRNIAVHDYQALNLDVVQNIINKHLTDFSAFASLVLTLK